jgi:hypothetical protein
MEGVHQSRGRVGFLAVAALLIVSSFVVVPSGFAAAASPTFAATEDFDAGTKSSPGDGAFGVETRTDNPGIASGVLELASAKGDAFAFADADADTFRWDIPASCMHGKPSTLLREISGGVLRIGANRASTATTLGVVGSARLSGDLDVRVTVDEVSTQANSKVTFSLIDEARCIWQGRRSADGVAYEWDEGTADGSLVLRALTVRSGAATLCGSATTVSHDPIVLRIARAGGTWSWSYSADGVTWTPDETCAYSAPADLYPSFLVADPSGGAVSSFQLDDYRAAWALPSGGFRASGSWTSPAFEVPAGTSIDRITILGNFTPTYALDRTEVLRGGTVVATFDADNLLTPTPASRLYGPDLRVRLTLKGDGRGTPVVDEVRVSLEAFYLVTSEAVTLGTSTGIAGQAFSDDVVETKTEALGPVESVLSPDVEAIVNGSLVEGNLSALAASDDVSVRYRESDAAAGALYAQGTFARKQDGPGLQTVSGVGFEGRALLLYWTRQGAFGTRIGLSAGIGLVATASQQASIAWTDTDNAVPSVSSRMSSASAIAILSNGSLAVDGIAQFVAFTPDGWILNWTTNPIPAQETIIHYVVLGASVTDAYVGPFTGPPAGATGLRSYAGVGFRPDAAIFLGSLQTSLGVTPHATMGFGAATGPSNQAAGSLAIPSGTITADTEEIQDDRRSLIMYNPALPEPTTDQVASLVSFDPDGFTLDHVKATSGDILFWGMLLRGGDFRVGTLTRPTVLGDQSIGGVGFRPDGVLFWGTASIVTLGQEDPGAEFILGAGSQSDLGVFEAVTWSGSNDRVSPTNANMHSNVNKVIRDLSLSSQGGQNEADYVRSDPDGFTINWTRVQGSSNQKWFFLAVRSLPRASRLEVVYEWTSLGFRSGEDALVVEARRSDEDVRVDVWNWSSSGWSARLTIGTPEDLDQRHMLLASEISSGFAVRVRFVSTIEAADTTRSDLSLDYLVMEKREYRLRVEGTIAGIPIGIGALLRLEGRSSGPSHNFNVYVWDWESGQWVVWIAGGFETSDLSSERGIAESEISAGEVRLLLTDVSIATHDAGSLHMDLIEVETPAP